jgi:hypothetical protein
MVNSEDQKGLGEMNYKNKKNSRVFTCAIYT